MFVSGNLFWWQSGRPHATSFVNFLTLALSSTPCASVCRNFKVDYTLWSQFWRSTWIQEGLSDIGSKRECTIESDNNRECAEAEWQNQVYPLQIFTESNILFLSVCILLEHNMELSKYVTLFRFYIERVKNICQFRNLCSLYENRANIFKNVKKRY